MRPAFSFDSTSRTTRSFSATLSSTPLRTFEIRASIGKVLSCLHKSLISASTMSESYDVDPDGDLKIVLSLSTSPFAQWKGDQELSPDDSNADANDIKDAHLAAEDSLLGSTPCQPIELRLKVSSKHLTLASRRFKKMLGGNWLEARTVHPDGCRHVNMEYFDPAALKILMDIIHGRTRKVPRSVELELLAKIAVLVDDLECYEEVEVFSELWLGELKHSTPDDLSRDLVLWILISIVFRQLDLFQRTTRTAIMCGTGPFESLELPIPKSVIGK